MTKTTIVKLCETVGSILAIVYAMLIASNTGHEILGFWLLAISSCLFAAWAVIDRRWVFLLLQGFYLTSAVIGLVRFAS